MAIPLVRASAVLPFVKFLDQIGAPSERLLQQAKLPISVLNNAEALIPLYQSFVFAEQAARFEGIETLGILVGQQTSITQLGRFGQLVCQSLTLYDLLCNIIQLVHTHNSGDHLWLNQQGEHIWLNHQFIGLGHVENPQSQYYVVQLCLNALQLVMGKEWQPEELWIQAGSISGLADLAVFSETPIRFNQPHNAIQFSSALFSLPLKPSAERSARLSAQDVDTLYASAPALEFASALRQLIRTLMQDGYPSVDLAAAAGMSRRTLQRRLTEHGLNYSRLVEQVRFETAVNLLKNPRIKLIEIGAELGYTDPANFTHAFKRWAGVSPRKFRDLLLKDGMNLNFPSLV